MCGCYTYSEREEKEADFAFSQATRKLGEAKAVENLIRARRDVFLKDSNIDAATQENEHLLKQQNSVKALQAQYAQARDKSLNTHEGTIKPDSPILGILKLFMREDQDE